MLLAIAIVIVVGAVAASAARLKFALAPTVVAPEIVEKALSLSKADGPSALARLETTLAQAPDADWEASLFAAMKAPAPVRIGLVNEELSELDHRMQRWVRVPRVCASICTSSGFLLAATVLRVSLGGESAPEGGVDAAVLQAINVAAVGLAGAAFCIAIQMRARTATASKAKAFDQLVRRLERAVDVQAPEEGAKAMDGVVPARTA